MILQLNEILEDVRNNDIRSLESFIKEKYETKEYIGGEYLGKTSVDFKLEYDAHAFIRALETLDASCKLKFNENSKYISFVMIELLPKRLGIELWAYREK